MGAGDYCVGPRQEGLGRVLHLVGAPSQLVFDVRHASLSIGARQDDLVPFRG